MATHQEHYRAYILRLGPGTPFRLRSVTYSQLTCSKCAFMDSVSGNWTTCRYAKSRTARCGLVSLWTGQLLNAVTRYNMLLENK